MKGIRWIFHDWKLLWSHKHGRIALVFLLIVPLIYAGFFLAGYWDPYGRLDQLPVAVVNWIKERSWAIKQSTLVMTLSKN
jgi:putative membrane protein